MSKQCLNRTNGRILCRHGSLGLNSHDIGPVDPTFYTPRARVTVHLSWLFNNLYLITVSPIAFSIYYGLLC
jgi:hypothetical protein